MPIYEYKCTKCSKEFEELLPFSQSDEQQFCPECGAEAEKKISMCDFILKGDGWTGKAIRVKSQMAVKNKKLDAKMRDLPKVTLQPNVDGERTDSWVEAKKLAASKGKIAETYDPLIQKEK